MNQYTKILNDLNKGICYYGNEKTGIFYSLKGMFKYKEDGKMQFFNGKQSMARSINKFIKTGR